MLNQLIQLLSKPALSEMTINIINFFQTRITIYSTNNTKKLLVLSYRALNLDINIINDQYETSANYTTIINEKLSYSLSMQV